MKNVDKYHNYHLKKIEENVYNYGRPLSNKIKESNLLYYTKPKKKIDSLPTDPKKFGPVSGNKHGALYSDRALYSSKRILCSDGAYSRTSQY